MEKLVPGGGALRGLTLEEFGIQGQDLRNIADVAAAIRNGLASFNEGDCRSREEVSGNGDLTPGTNQLSPQPQGKRLIQRDAGHGVRGLPATHYDIKEMSFVAG